MAQTAVWYRTRLDRDLLRSLTKRSDLRGLIQSAGILLSWLVTGGLSVFFFLEGLWVPMVIACLAHALIYGFLGMEASVHELSHGTPFKTKWLNEFFYGLFSFLTWNDPVHFRISHTLHHQHTTVKGEDYEIILTPAPLNWKVYLSWWLLDVTKIKMIWRPVFTRALGRRVPDVFHWHPEKVPLMADDDPRWKKIFAWNRFLIIGHIALIVAFVYFQLWILLFVVSFGYWFGGFFARGCGMMQHIGLTPNIRDWRVSCHTITMGQPVAFLYWNMNYHIEHHMYAAVPFFNLRKLHKAIAHDTPEPTRGFFRGFAKVVGIQKQQRLDPTFTYKPEFPETATRPVYPEQSVAMLTELEPAEVVAAREAAAQA